MHKHHMSLKFNIPKYNNLGNFGQLKIKIEF